MIINHDENNRDKWFRSVFESLNDAVFIHDITTGSILEANHRAVELYGTSLHEMRGLSMAEISANVPPYTQEDALDWMQKAIHEGSQLFEWQAKHISGFVFWVEINMHKVNIIGTERLVVTVRDISRRKQLENDLRRSEERFRAALGSSKNPVYYLNLSTLTYEYISQSVEQILGFSSEDLKDGGIRLVLSRIHPEDYQIKRHHLDQVMSGEFNQDFQQVIEYRFEHKSNGYRWISDHRDVIRDNTGNAVAIIGHLKDFTKRRGTEEALQKPPHAALLFNLENAPLALVESDISGRIFRWSKQAEKLFGWSSHEVLGKHYSEWNFVHTDDLLRVKSHFNRLLDRSETRNTCINRNLSRDGRVLVCEWHNSILINERGEVGGVMSLAFDITIEKKVEEAMRAMAEGVDTHSGEAFFQSLCLQVAQTLETKYALVAMILPERDRMARTLGFCNHGKIMPNFTFSLVGSPCRNVINGGICYYEQGVSESFPEDILIHDFGIESYLGLPLHSKDGNIIGLISAFSDQPLCHRERLFSMFQFFAARCSAELERHQVETALRKSEERYALAASGSTGGGWDWDIRTGEVYYSPRFRELLGQTLDNFPSLIYSWEQKMHPNDLPKMHSALDEHLQSHQPFNVECRILMQSGDYRWFEIRGQALWDESNEPYRMAGSILDINERKLNEQILLRLNQLHVMSSSFNEIIMRLKDPQQMYEVAVNTVVEKGCMISASIMLYQPDFDQLIPVSCAGELQNNRWDILLRSFKASPAISAYQNGKCIVENNIIMEGDYSSHEQTHSREFHSLATFPIKPGGESIGVLLVYSDKNDYFQEDELRVLCALTDNLSFALDSAHKEQDRQRASEALRENERMISTLMCNLPGAAYRSLNDEGRTLEFISDGCNEITGYEPENFEKVGKMFFGELIHPEDREQVSKSIDEAIAVGKRFEITYRIRTAKGDTKWIWERGQGITNNICQPNYIEGFMADITEKRLMEAQFLRAQRMESIGSLASGVAHDLNNILTPILMSLEILRMKITQPRDAELINAMENSANRGAEMVKQILSFARGIEGIKLLISPSDILGEIERLAFETFPKSISFQVNCATDVWNIEGDPTQLHQVLLNLCVNARDAMPNGGMLKISVNNTLLDQQFISIHPDAKTGPYVMFEIQDTGAGISPDLRDCIFDPFFTTKEFGKGTGLGLSTALSIVRAHHGFVDFTSKIGEGTIFCVYLPASGKSDVARKTLTEVSCNHGHGELILIVDDEVAIITATKQTLETFGYRVLTANDGKDAIATFLQCEEKPSVVITDMMMPNMDGPTLIQTLLEIKPDLMIIGASGLNQQTTTQLCSLGMKHFLHKPYSAEALLHALNHVFKLASEG